VLLRRQGFALPHRVLRMVRRLLLAGIRGAVHGLVALPLGLLALVAHGRFGAVRLRALRALAGARLDEPRSWLRFSVVTLPLDALAFVVLGYFWLLLPMNLLYPLRLAIYDETNEGSWGGPSMAGAWAVHAAGALAIFVVLGLPLAAGIAWLQARLAERAS
jgi:hypothetical protein